MRDFMWRLVHLNPALWRGLILTAVALLASVGIIVYPQLPDALIGFILALVPIVQALWTGGSVTPNAKVAVIVPDPVNEPNVVAAGDAVTNASNADIIAAAKS